MVKEAELPTRPILQVDLQWGWIAIDLPIEIQCVGTRILCLHFKAERPLSPLFTIGQFMVWAFYPEVCRVVFPADAEAALQGSPALHLHSHGVGGVCCHSEALPRVRCLFRHTTSQLTRAGTRRSKNSSPIYRILSMADHIRVWSSQL
jgi:hypothetical protein